MGSRGKRKVYRRGSGLPFYRQIHRPPPEGMTIKFKWAKNLLGVLAVCTFLWIFLAWYDVGFAQNALVGVVEQNFVEVWTTQGAMQEATRDSPIAEDIQVEASAPTDVQEESVIQENAPEETSVQWQSKDERINLRYCGSTTCKFLFAFKVIEQESKAQLHIRTLMRVAQDTDRILVFPNVGGSRIGACQRFGFDYYYSLESLRKTTPGVRVLTQNEFIQWLEERRNAGLPLVKASALSFGGSDNPQHVVATREVGWANFQRASCLSRFPHIEFTDRHKSGKTLSVHTVNVASSSKWYKKPGARTAVANLMINSVREFSNDVLMVGYGLQYKFFKDTPPPLAYADHLIARAKAATASLHPYIAVHWRMEQAPSKALPECAVRLVQYIHALQRLKGIHNVYIATDFPIDGGRVHSSTFRKFTEHHHRAVSILKAEPSVHTFSRLYVPSPRADNATRKDVLAEEEGPGVMGIIEKLILTRGEWFVSGPPDCSKGRSSFAGQIVEDRRRLLGERLKHVENRASRFSATLRKYLEQSSGGGKEDGGIDVDDEDWFGYDEVEDADRFGLENVEDHW